MYIAIDTSTEIAGIAIAQDSGILAEYTWHCGQNHTVELMPNLEYVLKRTGLNIKDAACIIVAKGPGSFNGLRVGVSAAKGLAFSLGVPLIGIGTLEAAAYQHAALGLPVCAISNAGRSEIAAAIYRKKRNLWCQLKEEHITTIDVLCAEIVTKTIFTGDYSPEIAAKIKEVLQQKVVIPSAAARLRRAGFLIELGQDRIKIGAFDNPATLQPLYLRRPPITEPKRKY